MKFLSKKKILLELGRVALDLPVMYESLTPEERTIVRDRYATVQDGKCYLCGMYLVEPPTSAVVNYDINEKLFPHDFFKTKQHLHHHHKTGLTLGTVHARCNAYLWQVKGE